MTKFYIKGVDPEWYEKLKDIYVPNWCNGVKVIELDTFGEGDNTQTLLKDCESGGFLIMDKPGGNVLERFDTAKDAFSRWLVIIG